MEDNRLHKILRSLSQEELRDFLKFAQSPWFCRKPKCAAYLEVVLEAKGKFDSKSLLKGNLLEKLFGKGAVESNLVQLRSELGRLFRAFMVQQQLEQQANTQRFLLLEGFSKHKLDDLYDSELEDFEQSFDREQEMLLTRYRLQEIRLHQAARTQSGLDLAPSVERFNHYALLEKLKQGYALLSDIRVHGGPAQHWLLTELDFLVALHRNTIRAQPLLEAHYQMFESLKNMSPTAALLPAQQVLDGHPDEMPDSERKELRKKQSAYLTMKFNAGHFSTLPELDGFYQIALLIFKELDEKNWLLEEEYLPPLRFKNVLTTALNTGDIQWAEDFLERHLPHIHPDHRKAVKMFSRGAIDFYAGRFPEALETLAQADTKLSDFFYLDINSMKMRICLEDNEERGIETIYDNVRKRLAQKNVAPNHVEGYGNFYKMLKKMFRLKNDPNTTRSKWEVLYQELEQTNPVNQKKWLLERVAKMI